MKRLFSLLMVFALLLQPLPACASGGDPNIEGGGGDMNWGSGESWWHPGDEGVRVSIMRGTTAIATFDLSNRARTDVQRCYQKKCKLYYKNGGELRPSANYANWTPPSDIPLPTVISTGGGNNIEAIRNYFTDESVIRFIIYMTSSYVADLTYERLISGDYKLLLEPIAYFHYNGVMYAMTATEAALFDVASSGDLRFQMGRLTHQNLVFSMFLERADLGIQAWTGATTGKNTPNIDILKQLGVGIVSFVPEVLIPDPPQAEYVYRCDTDVITAALVPNRGGDLTPSSRAGGRVGYATFRINGVNYRKQMVCPSGGTQLVWVKWHTPSEPCEMTVTVTPPNGGGDIEISVRVDALEERIPPDPGYDGPLEGPGITHTEYRPNFRLETPPDWGSQTSATWDQWIATLEEEWVDDREWVEDDSEAGGHWEDCGYWDRYWVFSMATYSASLRIDFHLQPNGRVPTAVRRGNKYIMGSGYGVDAVCGVTVSAHASGDDVTRLQHVLAVFPEFDYRDYYRLLEPESRVAYRCAWGFKPNPYSYYGEPVHFTPLWYPDMDYPVQLAAFDCWTPGGQLWASARDAVEIKGNVYDDWYIRVY
ncbi:MAG: hypothetical protein HFF06_04215 [Oscillospiraceae bacterium]|jgi:hypothetical protein|nr:hypothetical protein [Oscillospiraceae bacterium]